MVLAAIGAGEELRAEADAEDRPVQCGEIGHQAGEIGQVGVGMVVDRRLFPAEHHQRIRIDRGWQGLARPGLVDVDQRRSFVQGDADLAMMGDAGVLDDGDAHGASLLSG